MSPMFPFKQVVVTAGEGAKAALAVYDYIINQRLIFPKCLLSQRQKSKNKASS
jgi:hypothetical protein